MIINYLKSDLIDLNIRFFTLRALRRSPAPRRAGGGASVSSGAGLGRAHQAPAETRVIAGGAEVQGAAALAEADAVAAYYAERARAYLESPPGTDWDRIANLTKK
jgi:hypothetical protein